MERIARVIDGAGQDYATAFEFVVPFHALTSYEERVRRIQNRVSPNMYRLKLIMDEHPHLTEDEGRFLIKLAYARNRFDLVVVIQDTMTARNPKFTPHRRMTGTTTALVVPRHPPVAATHEDDDDAHNQHVAENVQWLTRQMKDIIVMSRIAEDDSRAREKIK